MGFKKLLFFVIVSLICTSAWATNYKMRYNPQTGRGDWVVDASSLGGVGGASALTGLTDVTTNYDSGKLLIADGVKFNGVALSGDATISSAGVLDLGSAVVGSTELSSTTVTPGSYVLTNLTVDGDGRITAATSSTVAGGAGGIRYAWTANGPYIVDTSVDGGFISDTDFEISSVWLYRTNAGSSGSTIIDLNKNGTTMYTTQGNRPTIAFNDGDNKVDCTLPDVVAVTAGDVLTIDTDQIESGTPADYVLIVEGS